MSFKNKLMILVLSWVLLGASNALAKDHDHSQHLQSTVVSPFEGKIVDGKIEVRSLHCLLKGHTHQKFCPHSKPERNQTATIASDCGGKTTPSVPNTTSFSNDLGVVAFIMLTQSSSEKMLVPPVSLSYHSRIDSLDPPPRIL